MDKYLFIFILVILVVSLIVKVYLRFYLVDKGFGLMVSLFVWVILNLVIRVNLLSLMIWWDLLGWVSLLLIMYYGTNLVLNLSGLVMVFNRLRDLFMILSLVIIYLKFRCHTMCSRELE